MMSPIPHRPIKAAWQTRESVLIGLWLIVYGFTAAPLPGINETHYLAKAKHFWDPTWCDADLFLDSANAHAVFYATLGAFTQWLSFPTVAVIGRLLAYGLFAVGWSRLGRALGLVPGIAFCATLIFTALQSIGNWSGEWVIGGIESKVFAYGLVLWATVSLLSGQRWQAALLQGGAIAIHPLVGLWSLIAAAGGLLATRVMDRSGTGDARSLPSRSLGPGCLMGLVALPGLIPVLQLVMSPAAPATRYAGTYLQVYYRLAHHLDPMTFPWRAHAGYLALLVVWWLGWRASSQTTVKAAASEPRATAVEWLHWSIAAAVGIALIGVVLGAGPRPPKEMPWFDTRMQLLKFYPFRLADAVLPMMVAWQLAAWSVPRLSARRTWCLATTLVGVSLSLAVFQAGNERIARTQSADWQAACRWIEAHTPIDALVQTPQQSDSFKWFAQRAEYVTFKDCPQDVTGIVEWNRRLRFLSRWYQDHFADGVYSVAEMTEFTRATGITHVLTNRLGPFEQAPVYQNGTYRVYDLRSSITADKKDEPPADHVGAGNPR